MAIDVALLVHMPPEGVEPKVVVEPWQIDVGPVNAVGRGLTTTVTLPDMVLTHIVVASVATTE